MLRQPLLLSEPGNAEVYLATLLTRRLWFKPNDTKDFPAMPRPQPKSPRPRLFGPKTNDAQVGQCRHVAATLAFNGRAATGHMLRQRLLVGN